MSVTAFLADLAKQGVQVWSDGEQLHYQAPKDVMTASLLSQLRTYKTEILALLSHDQENDLTVSLPQLVPAPAEVHWSFPTTDVQQAYWIGRSTAFELSNVGSHCYVEVEAVDLDLARSLAALRRLIKRHQMLRAIILPDGQEQILEHVPPFTGEFIDLQKLNQQDQDEQLAHIRSEMDHKVFQVERWPVWAVRISRLHRRHVRIHFSMEVLFVDAWSLRTLLQEFLLLYHEPDAHLPPLELSFRDYVLAVAQLQHSEWYRRSQDYWVSRIGELPSAPELPLAIDPASLLQPRFVPRQARLEAGLWQRLKARGVRSGLTPSGILLAAFAEVLTTWSKTPRFCINLTTFNRLPLHEQVNDIVGDFTSLLLLAVDNSFPDVFEQRAKRLQEQLWDDLDHPYYSGVRVLRDLARIQREEASPLSTQAIMPVVFTSLLGQQTAMTKPAPWGKPLYFVTQTPQVWLDHQVMEEAGHLLFYWHAVEELFPPDLLDAMFAAYTQLLERLATDDELWQHHSCELVPATQLAQRAQVNATDAPITDALLQDLFLEQARLRPTQLAVISAKRTLTYHEVQRSAVLLGHQLRQLGARPNQLIGVVMEKGWEQVVGVLAVLLSGAAYLPIDPKLPQERLTWMLAHGEVQLLLTQSWLNQRITWPKNVTALCVDNLKLDEEPIPELPSAQHPDDLAYVIFTSGSTGVPKGVMIDHRGAVNTILDVNRRFHVGHTDRVLALSALHFDLSVYDLFGLLAAGGTIVVPPEDSLREPAIWLDLLVQEHVTLWNTVPALLQMLVDSTAPTASVWQDTSLRLALLSGDWIPLPLPERIKERIPAIQVISLGGATEASIWSILFPIERMEPSWKSIPYGKPMRNQRFFVLNDRLDPCPVWVPGHLYIAGAGLAKGYWRDEAQTQSSFFPHPHTGERFYRTGDVGRYLPDGTIQFLGRDDLQVKISGHRIELGEIEVILGQHPQVSTAVVVLHKETADVQQLAPAATLLVAYIVSREPEIVLNHQELRTYLQAKLPEYMVPQQFVTLSKLPLTSNGKVDRHALPAPAERKAELSPTPALSTPIEEMLITIWSEVLGRSGATGASPVATASPVGLHDNFFALGGQSLLAVKLVYRVKAMFQVELPLSSLFEAHTVAEMARCVEDALRSQHQTHHATIPPTTKTATVGTGLAPVHVPTPTLPASTETVGTGLAPVHVSTSTLPASTETVGTGLAPVRVPAPTLPASTAIASAQMYEPFPTTDVQQAYWIGRHASFELGNVGNHFYLEVDTLDLDLPRSWLALQRLIERHPMLHAVILPDGQQQILEQIPPFAIEYIDLLGLDQQDKARQLVQIRSEMDHQLFHVELWPVWTIRVSRVQEHRVRIHFSMESLFADAWSMRILQHEFLRLHQEPQADLPPLHLSFRDYILAVAQLQTSQQFQRAQDYWTSRLHTLPPAPDLPLVIDPSTLSRPRFVPRHARMQATQWQQLKARGAQRELTPSAILLAAFAEVLSTWSRTPHFCLNLTLFNRFPLHEQVNEIVGDFSSLLLLQIDSSTADRFEQRAKRIQEQLWQDFEHRSYSGVRVLRDLARQRREETRAGSDPDSPPPTQAIMPVVFTSLLAQETATTSSLSWQNISYYVTQTPQVWLDHQVMEEAGNLLFYWHAVEELFPPGLLDAMFEVYTQFLHRLATDDQLWQSRSCELVPATQLAQRAQVNATDAPIADALLQDLFLQQARLRPDQLAVISARRTLTYQELRHSAVLLGHQLRQLGACPNQLVAVVMEKGWEQVVGVLAVLLSGAAYLPIDPKLPQERLTWMLTYGEVQLLLTQSWVNERIVWPKNVTALCVDRLKLDEEPIPEWPSLQHPDDLAYVIYTSGSTGVPKGVMIDHRGAVNTILDVNQRFHVGHTDRVLALSALHFDLSVYDLFGLLAAGGTIVLPAEEALHDPAAWLALATQQRVTLWNTVPAFLQMLVEYAEAHPGALQAPSLRLALLSGDWIPLPLPDRFRTLMNDRATRPVPLDIVSLGGATEASIWSILFPIERMEPSWKSIPYGKPMRNQRFFVLNDRLDPCPVWVPGHLYIAGVGLAKGYWRDEAQTQSSFFPHPHTGERLYRTGDLGRYLPDGTIQFLGRDDLQVKISGHRIELGEIEVILGQHPQVSTAVVVIHKETTGVQQLVAYVVSREPETVPTGEQLRTYLQTKLPEYMVPRQFVPLTQLPLTPNGKVDRHALPAPAEHKVELSPASALSTPIEEMLITIWSEVLGRSRATGLAPVGLHDNFFALGGQSLLAVKLVYRVKAMFQVELPLSSLFEAHTVAEMARCVEDALRSQHQTHHATIPPTTKTATVGTGQAQGTIPTATSVPTPPVVPEPTQMYEPFPTTEVQQAYWIGRHASFELGNVGNHFYLEVDTLDLDLPRSWLALQRLIERHPMLHAVILPDGQQQILEQIPPFAIEYIDLLGLDPQDIAQQLAQIRSEMDHQLFPVELWPVWTIRVSRVQEQRVRIHFSMESLFADAWSMRILQQEFLRLYQEPQADFSPLHLSFRDYILAVTQLQTSQQFQRAQDYWTSRLHTLPPAPDLPLVIDPSTLSRPRFVPRHARMQATQWQQLKARGAQRELTPSAILLAAFAEVLSTWSRTPHFCLNLTLFNRFPLHEQVNDIVGDFTSLLLLTVDNSFPDVFEQRAKRIQEQLWQDFEHRSYSGVRVLRDLARQRREETRAGSGPDSPPPTQAIMPVVFTSLLAQETASTSSPSWQNISYYVAQTPQVWLDHQVMEEAGNLLFYWHAVEELFPPGLLDAMFEAYTQLLERLATDDQLWQSHSCELVPATQLAQRAQVNATDAPIADALLQDLFLQQARLRPDQLAVISARRTLTYHEIRRSAVLLGHQLRQLGACPNQLIGVVMEKGWEQVVGVLAVLLSGAAYLPIDPRLPQERLTWMLAHGEVQLLLTQSWLNQQITWPKNVTALCVDNLKLDEEPIPELPSLQHPDDLAYVIYTSGSTGVPKGVMIDHRGAVNTILDVNQRFHVGHTDRVLALSALHFDLSVYDLFGLLAAGGTIVVPPEDSLRESALWIDLLVQEHVTIWNTVPALLQMLVEYTEAHPGILQASSLRLALLSGDWIPLSLPDRFRALMNDGATRPVPLDIVSLGGATEASIWSILFPIGRMEPSWKSIPYGKPMRNQRFFVLNDRLDPCPVWVPGHLYIAGAGLAKGYWRDEAQTQRSFFPHPQTGERLYRTGDVGRYLPDGTIQFLGRDDFQVKISGHRIELGEIEQTLLQHPAVQAAVVTTITEQKDEKQLALTGRKQLIAYVVLQSEQTAHEGKNSSQALYLRFGMSSIRNEKDKPVIDLTSATPDADMLRKYRERLSYRQFLPEPLSLRQLSGFLKPLSRIELDGLPKYLYPSAGSIYPVQAYLSIKSGCVEGVAAGVYYYNPESHQLTRMSDAHISRNIHATINQPTFDQSAFSLFLIGDLTAISLHYGDAARGFCLLEAGYMGQLLMMTAAEHHIGLCPVAGLDFLQYPLTDRRNEANLTPLPKPPDLDDSNRTMPNMSSVFALGENHVLLHSFLCGRVDPNVATGWSFPLTEPEKSTNPPPTTPTMLHQFLQEKLPEYMLPSVILVLDHLPLTPNGKVDRKHLPRPESEASRKETVGAGLAPARTEPTSEIEQTVAAVWQEVLDQPQVGIYDNFFDLGGDSLLGLRMMNRLREIFEIDLSMHLLFTMPTVAGLAEVIRQQYAELLGEEELTEVLKNVSQISEEEAMLLLEQKFSEQESAR